MRLGILALFLDIFCTIMQIFFTGAKATVNSGNLILNSGVELEINTTVPSVVKSPCIGCSFTASHQTRNSSHGDNLVAVIEFSGDIEFRSGSTVKVFGKFALSIASQNGHILIQTDINMTCGENVFDTTCLGGFTQSSAAQLVGSPVERKDLYKGLGPGGLTVIDSDFLVDRTCILGSSHGGTTSDTVANQYLYSGEAYDTQNITSLLGGSGGSCLQSSGGVAGGGAIELVAKKGWIIINASIIASAQIGTESGTYCSGGSGGLIRLKARRVEIQEKGKLNVDGGRAHQYVNIYYLGGGAGGIIQIISPDGNIATGTLFLKQGDKSLNGIGMCEEAEPGYLTVSNISNSYPIFPTGEPYSWSQSSSPPRISPSSTVTTIQQNISNSYSIFPTGGPYSWSQSSFPPRISTSSTVTTIQQRWIFLGLMVLLRMY